MSIKVMTYVWDHSQHSGSELLMLLAIADHANDDGKAWPHISRLAERCRVSKRMAIYIIKKLEQAGSLSIEHGRGRGHPSVYSVNSAAHCTFYHETVQPIAPFTEEKVQSIAPITAKGAAHCTLSSQTVQPIAPFTEEKVQSSVIKGAIQRAPSFLSPSDSPSYISPREPSVEPITQEEENSHENESFPGAVNGVYTPGHADDATPIADTPVETKQKRTPSPISDKDWPGLSALLERFELPIDQLNDNDWWNDLSYTCNSPTNQWLERQFAKMHAWLRENAHKAPKTGWKRFVRRWLEKSYEEERRSYASQKTTVRR